MFPDRILEHEFSAAATLPLTVTIPAGEFWMGESEGDKFANDTERPRHLVRIARPFRLMVFPVTRALLRGRAANLSIDDNLPATGINWTEAVAFCRALGGRLPSEAEWEYAARAGTVTPFPGGFDLTVSEANFLYSEHGERIGLGHTTPSGTHPPNAFGLEAMAGNVCGWCADAWHPDHVDAPVDGSARTDARYDLRVIRGGAWDYLPRLLRSSWRDGLPASTFAFHLEDMEMCTAIQRGMYSLGAQRGRLSHLEMSVWLMQRYLAARSRGTWPARDQPAAPSQR